MARQNSTSIYRTLLGEILNRTLPDGSRLPKEQDLATRFGVSRSTVRKAMSASDELGISSEAPFLREKPLPRIAIDQFSRI